MTDWKRVAQAAELPQGTGREIVVAGQMIAIFHTESGWYAIDGTCPHHGGPLGQGELNGDCVSCPWHGLCIDVTTGRYDLGESQTLTRYPIRVEQDWIEVSLDETGC